MGRKLQELQITTRNARSNLTPGLHWRGIDPDVHLGYNKKKRGGNWLVRWRVTQGYHRDAIGNADDIIDADGVNTLSFSQAVAAAKAHVIKKRAEEIATVAGPIPIVRDLCGEYLDVIKQRFKRLNRPLPFSNSKLNLHVIGDEIIAGLQLNLLRSQDIRDWKERIRKKNLKETTVRRIANDFRAALNESGTKYYDKLTERFLVEVRDGFKISHHDPAAVSERPNIVLRDADIGKLLDAAREIDAECRWDGDLYALVVALAATGARFSQLSQATISALQPELKRLMVPSSNKGRGQKRNSAPVPIAAAEIKVLISAAGDRSPNELLFLRWGYKHDEGINWKKNHRRGWQTAELSEPFRLIVNRAGFSDDVTAYSLRHSSIVRGLRQNLPPRLVAALHDTSSEMIERHYSAFIADALDETAANAVVSLL